MTTLAKHIIVVGAENHPPMLEKSMYDSWSSHRLDLRSTLNSLKNNNFKMIVMFKLLTSFFMVFHSMCMHLLTITRWLKLFGIKSRFYDLLDMFSYVQGETFYEYYWRFLQLINNMHTIGMTMQQVQVNTKFLNARPLEWSKFVIDVKLARACILPPMIRSLRFPPLNNQLRTSSNPRNQAPIQDGRVTVQQIQGRQSGSFASTGNKENAKK
nr:hypothetical protein [Tanacetum cinerariifolium]